MDTFLTTLYVIIDDFCQAQPPKRRPGPEASLSESEVITLAIFARCSRFASERDFYRYASGHLRDTPSRPCPSAPSSTGWCVPMWSSSRLWPCIWQ
jgi:hypothetical protein